MQNYFKTIFIFLLLVLASNSFAQKKSLNDIRIGDLLGGGVVYFIDSSITPARGLIVAAEDAPDSNGYTWGSFYNRVTTSYDLFSGITNMENLDAQDGGSEAAKAATSNNPAPQCSDPILYCTDWYLPSQNELMVLWVSKEIAGLSGFVSQRYWSSTEGGNYHTAWSMTFADGGGFSDGSGGPINKQNNYGVRAIRSFVTY